MVSKNLPKSPVQLRKLELCIYGDMSDRMHPPCPKMPPHGTWHPHTAVTRCHLVARGTDKRPKGKKKGFFTPKLPGFGVGIAGQSKKAAQSSNAEHGPARGSLLAGWPCHMHLTGKVVHENSSTVQSPGCCLHSCGSWAALASPAS